MDGKNQKKYMAFILVIGLLFITFIFFGAGSKYSIYLFLVAIVVISFYLREEFMEEDQIKKGVYDQLSSLGEDSAFNADEKKYIIFHLLTKLEENNSLNMEEIASEYDFPIYSLNNLVEWLERHGIVKLTYPPMKNLPVIRLENKTKCHNLRKRLFKSMAPRDILGNPLKKDFVRQISDFLAKHRRNV
jgi:hypothetical protein